jgi:hypothetical protein
MGCPAARNARQGKVPFTLQPRPEQAHEIAIRNAGPFSSLP